MRPEGRPARQAAAREAAIAEARQGENMKILPVVAVLALAAGSAQAQAPRATPSPLAPGTVLHIIAFGAHPDDCELNTSGVAAKWAALGHKIKCVSVTNGDIGHWQSPGGPLAVRRRGETQRAAHILGTRT